MSQSDSLFSRCCCCIPLRAGCFLLAYTNLILTLVATISTISDVVDLADIGFFDLIGTDLSNMDTDSSDLDTRKKALLAAMSVIGIFVVMCLAINLIWFVASICCLVGVHKRDPSAIRTHVAIALMRLFLHFVELSYSVILEDEAGLFTIISFVHFGVTVYFITVYYVYAKQLERELASRKKVQEAYVYPKDIDKHILVLAQVDSSTVP